MEKREAITPQLNHLITLDMLMVFKRNDNKLECCQWFSAVVYYIEMMGYIAQENLNIRIHRDIASKMWFVDGVRINL